MTSKTGKQGGDRRIQRLSLASVCVLAGLLVGGCSNTNQGHLTGDPLFGEFGIKQPGPASPPMPSTPATKSQAGLPPIPAAQFSPSPAALAAGPLPGARPLAIDGGGGNNNIIPASVNGGGTAGAALRPIVAPVPRENTPSGLTVVPAAAPAWASQAPASQAPIDPDAAVREQLKARGVLYSKVDTLPDGVRLSVIVPKGGDATRVLEATGRDFNSAAQAILQKLGN